MRTALLAAICLVLSAQSATIVIRGPNAAAGSVAGGGGGSCGGSAPTFDAASEVAAPGNGVATISWSHTCTGADGLLCVFIGQGVTGGTPVTINSVTYNGDALTKLTGYASSFNFCHVDMWYRVAPDTGGSFTIEITAASAVDQLVGSAISLANVCASTSFGTPVPATGTASPATTTVTSAATELVVGCLFTDDNAGIAVTTGTERFEIEDIESDTSWSGLTATGAASVSPAWSIDSAPQDWACSAVSVKGK